MSSLPMAAFVTLLTVLLLFVTALNVGRARVRYGIKAPAVSGHEVFERAFRIQMNTLENTVLMLPALWLYAGLIGDRGAGMMGIVWLVGRGETPNDQSAQRTILTRGWLVSSR